MSTLQCRRCFHTWTPRIERPVMCPRCHSPFWNRDRRTQATKHIRGISNPAEARYDLDAVAKTLNQMVKDGIVRRWVIYGSVAYALWMVPLSTHDVDVMIPVKDDREYANTLTAMASAAGGFSSGGFAIRVADVRVEVFPSDTAPLYAAAFADAASLKTLNGEPVLVVRPEYLAVMALAAWRTDPVRGVDDRQRARNLVATGRCDLDKVRKLVDRYGATFPNIKEGELRRRFAAVL